MREEKFKLANAELLIQKNEDRDLGRPHQYVAVSAMLPHDPLCFSRGLRDTLIYVPAAGHNPFPSDMRGPARSLAELVRRAHASGGGRTAAVDILNLPCWELLLERIGTQGMHHLLTSFSLFWSLPNRCLFQLTGPPPLLKAKH